MSENTKANYTEMYDSLLKMKNHVIIYGLGYLGLYGQGVSGSFYLDNVYVKWNVAMN